MTITNVFKTQLKGTLDCVKGLYVEKPTLPVESDFYEEFKQEYREADEYLEKAIEDLNGEISAWNNILKDKVKNPLETGLKVEAINKSSIKNFNDAMNKIKVTIDKHNHKSENFKAETKKAKEKLEHHYAADKVKSFDYYSKKEEISNLKKEKEQLETTIADRKNEIENLENLLSNESLGADQFNESLHRFLGRSELTLRFNPDKKGYEIFRNKSSEPFSGNLSESEKTAIAFVYFMTKLKEKDNKIEDTIVVVDDPISSFDSNHLFHAYSFMQAHCKKAKQLLVLTHNFTFFKLVRDWILRANERNPSIYTITSSNEKSRASTYEDAKSALIKYNSEYQYIFSRLHLLKKQQSFETDDHFLAANLSRRLLEIFLSFKFPKKRKSFTKLLREAISQSAKIKEKEKIIKFVHQYSHSDLIETNEDFFENLAGEHVSVISDVFDLIKELDEKHYKEMEEISK